VVSDMIERSVHHSIEDRSCFEQLDHYLILYQLVCSDVFVLALCGGRGRPHPVHFARGTHEQHQQRCVRIDTWLLQERTERGDCLFRAKVVQVADVRYLKNENVSSGFGDLELNALYLDASKRRLWEKGRKFSGIHVEELKFGVFS
jgi:hypothetical protein